MRWGLSVCEIKRCVAEAPSTLPPRPPSQARLHLERLSWQRADGLSFLLVHTGACVLFDKSEVLFLLTSEIFTSMPSSINLEPW